MFGRKDKDAGVVDAGAELDRLDGEYGASDLGSQRRQSPPGSRMFLLVVACAIIAVGGAFTWKAMSNLGKGKDEPEKPVESVSQVIPKLTPKPIPVEEKKPDPEPVQPVQPVQTVQTTQTVQPTSTEPRQKTQAELIRERMLNSGLEGEGGADMSAVQARAGATGQGGSLLGGGGGGGELAEKLQPMRLNGSKAGMLRNRDFMLTQANVLDCTLETKMVTTQPGMTKCKLTRNVYSANGRVVLLEQGTVVTGFYQGGITQGQARIFVQWSRAETPAGVIVNLDSPGTGPLGEAGVGGWTDTHFWERFGGAIMISLIGDLGQYAAQSGRSSGNNSVQFSNTAQGTSQAAAEALRNSVNIPPTLYKNAGERVSIFVARDLDFSDVYSLRANTQ